MERKDKERDSRQLCDLIFIQFEDAKEDEEHDFNPDSHEHLKVLVNIECKQSCFI